MRLLHQLYIDYRNSLNQPSLDQSKNLSEPNQSNSQPVQNPNNTQQLKELFMQRLNASALAELYEKDEDEYSILAFAALYDDTETLKSVLKKIPRFTETDVTHYFFPMLCATNKLSETNITLFLQHGANINALHETIDMPLIHLTARSGDLDPTKLLLKLGADITVMSEFDRLIATGGRKSIFDRVFSSETADIKQKIELLNYLFLWAWSKNITVDLTGITIDPALIEHLIVLNARLNGAPITKSTPSFEQTVTNFDALLNSPKHDNYKEFFLAVKRRIQDGDTNPQLLDYAAKLKEKWLSTFPVAVRDVLNQTFFGASASVATPAAIGQKTGLFTKSRENFSPPMSEQVAELEDILTITPGKTATGQGPVDPKSVPPAPLSEEDRRRQLLNSL